jgi:putative Mn2+ efflux pump MntP
LNRHVTSRIIAAALLGILGGFLIHHDEVKWGARGRDAFMAHELHRFETTMAVPLPLPAAVCGATILVAGVLGIYEVMAFGFAALLAAKNRSGENR